MSLQSKDKNRSPYRLPHLGQRIIKTTVAVFLCLLFYYLRGYRGEEMPTEAVITAILCMQPYIRDTRDFAVNRLAGTLIGAFWGLMFLLLLLLFPSMASNMTLLYVRMALGVLVSLYTAVALRMPDASSLAAIVYICVVISFPEIVDPLRQAFDRILGVLLGTVIAIGVNHFRLPRGKNRELVLFVRTKDLAPDRFSPIPSAALYRLNYLYNDGAKICLMSEHAPAFFSLQMNQARLSVPQIVMDGAAIFDANENEYLHTVPIGAKGFRKLKELLDSLGFSYFIYTVHNHRTCIFHQGRLSEQESVLYERMRRSPYRNYLDEDNYAPEEVVYCKLISDPERIEAIRRRLQTFLRSRRLRAVVLDEAGAEGLCSLYIYSADATMQKAEETLMAMLREKDPALRPAEIFLDAPYRSEHDAMTLLNRITNAYEPIRFLPRRKTGGKKER